MVIMKIKNIVKTIIRMKITKVYMTIATTIIVIMKTKIIMMVIKNRENFSLSN